jgi:putative transposase
MPENARLSVCIDRIELSCVEREATPQLLLKLSIQLHLAGLSLPNTILFLILVGVERYRSTVHNWVHRTDLQPDDGQSPNHVAVDETVIRLNDEQYWLCAAADLEQTNYFTQRLNRPKANVLAHSFFRELHEKPMFQQRRRRHR